MNVFALPLLPIMLNLGFWQLDRADEKREILAAQEQLLQAEPIRISNEPVETYRPITLIGKYDQDKHFLLDNVVNKGAVGFDVITPFYDESGQVVLVNRGWLKAAASRADLPVITTPKGRQILVANVGRNLGKPFLLGDQVFGDSWPMVIQAVELPKMAVVLDAAIGDYFARLEIGAAGAYQHHYQVVNILPSKHTGYSVQWFAMTIALFVLYLLFGFGKFSTTSKVH